MNKSSIELPIFISLQAWKVFLAFLLMFSVGCIAEKKSLHEMDHELPSHWPNSMDDAAQKIELRLGRMGIKESQKENYLELVDLIEWVPEVAADTDLPEADWVPIYELSETLRQHLKSSDISIEDCREDLERLIVLLRESHTQLPVKNLTMQN